MDSSSSMLAWGLRRTEGEMMMNNKIKTMIERYSGMPSYATILRFSHTKFINLII